MRPNKPVDLTWPATVAILVMMVGATAAFAQTGTPPAVPDQPSPNTQTPPDTQTPPGDDPNRMDPSQTPSRQLGERGGVVKPPDNVDHSIVKPPPQTGTMPVIPPPGTPGGDPNVQPK